MCEVELLFEILTPERLLFDHIKYKASCSIDNTESNTGVGFESGTKIGISAAVCAESYIYRKHHKASAFVHSCNSNKGGKLTFMRAIITT